MITAGKRTEDHEYPADKSTPSSRLTAAEADLARPQPADRLPDSASARPIDVVAYVRVSSRKSSITSWLVWALG